MNIRLLEIMAVLLTVLLTGCAEKYALDRQMEELCKKDGGVKIYETVKLPPEVFDQFGQPKFATNDIIEMPKNMQAHKLGDVYTYIIEDTILKNGDPLKGESYLGRTHYKIQRNSDKKILAEAIQYLRAGGDLFVIGHHTSATCPNEPMNITEKVFIKKLATN